MSRRIVPHKTKAIAEFGDFQTPPELARRVCQWLRGRGCDPAAIIEPTCGRGNFLTAALEAFENANQARGWEINPSYAEEARDRLASSSRARSEVARADFFEINWPSIVQSAPKPLLILGNPPWVTNSGLAVLNSQNTPQKANFENHAGIAAITGKSNFDISEWMLLRLVEAMHGQQVRLAMLCKTAVARKVLAAAWRRNWQIGPAHLMPIDSKLHFAAAVDAALLVIDPPDGGTPRTCGVHSALWDSVPTSVIGWRDDFLVSDAEAFDRWSHLGGNRFVRWRSGIKHDCSKVFELRRRGARYENGLGEIVELEREFVFPLLKGSDVFHGATESDRFMLVTQRTTGEDTAKLKHAAPLVWNYLQAHAQLLDQRRSTIYRGRPPFSVFGVGAYSFAPWKVAISALHKELRFGLIGCLQNQPTMLDDTCYFVPCATHDQARAVLDLLSTKPGREFLTAQIFWDCKRPITTELLQRIDLDAVAVETGADRHIRSAVGELLLKRKSQVTAPPAQRPLFA